jgi:hypothetical protein
MKKEADLDLKVRLHSLAFLASSLKARRDLIRLQASGLSLVRASALRSLKALVCAILVYTCRIVLARGIASRGAVHFHDLEHFRCRCCKTAAFRCVAALDFAQRVSITPSINFISRKTSLIPSFKTVGHNTISAPTMTT